MPTPWEIIGEEGFTRLTRAFYARVPRDDILGPMYPPDDLDGAELRLRLFLIFRFGGPDTYVQRRGHPRLRLRHAPFPLDARAAERWLALMDAALEEAGLPQSVAAELRAYFRETAHFLINTGQAPPEPLVTLVFVDADANTPIGSATVRRAAIEGGFAPGTRFGLSGVNYVLARAEPAPGGDNDRVMMYVAREHAEHEKDRP
ncbi:MAG: hypothetical protein HS108_14165 [Planctomycetes bacterium]|nr:hypothetical protein [Planctomycetota bacterium]